MRVTSYSPFFICTQFAQFPQALSELPNLAELDMEVFILSLLALVSSFLMRVLSGQGNQMVSLGDIGQLTALERLYLNSNRFGFYTP